VTDAAGSPAKRPRGRPRGVAPLHMVVMRELGGAMRQIRSAAGFESLDAATEVLNSTIRQLYPGVPVRLAATAPFSQPHEVSPRYISDLELGNTSKVEVPAWLLAERAYQPGQLRGSQIPAWLIRAYDVAFVADGYLVDLHRWATALHADQASTPPRASHTRRLASVDLAEYDRAAAAFAASPAPVRAVLDANRTEIAAFPGTPGPGRDWLPDARDRCTNINPVPEIPEGLPARPGTFLVGRWILRNSGDIPWEHKVFTRVGRFDAGLITPPFAPLPATPPGADAEVRVPVRVPDRPGTYRLAFRLAWPDGVYCYPNTLVGSIMTITVLPESYAGCELEWPVR
jgi:Ig-like domain-containing protein